MNLLKKETDNGKMPGISIHPLISKVFKTVNKYDIRDSIGLHFVVDTISPRDWCRSLIYFGRRTAQMICV